MNNDNEKRVYFPIGSARLLDIKVILDDKVVYNGMVDDAPEDIRKLKYSKISLEEKFTYYVYSELQ